MAVIVTLTEEQKAVVEAPLKAGETALVLARAGTGKTTCLQALAEHNPGTRILYLVFNRQNAKDAGARFPRNCEVKTSHALAYRYEGHRFKKKGFGELSLSDIRQELQLDSFNEAYWIRESLKRFHQSGEHQLEPKHLRGPYLGENHVELIQKLWERTCDPTSGLRQSYDGYLKLFSDNICRGAYSWDPMREFEVVMLDEGHDTNPCVARLIRHLAEAGRHALVLIGDSHQAIYGWRGAVDAMAEFRRLPKVCTFQLTGSFRFGPDIAEKANQVLNLSTTLERGPDVIGLGGKPGQGERAILGRTNRALLTEAIELLDSGEACALYLAATTAEKNWDPSEAYNFGIFRSTYLLWAGLREKGMHPRMCQFQSFEELTRYLAELRDDDGDSLDPELAGAVRFVEQYAYRVPTILDAITQACTSPQKAEVVFSTAHRSKGGEWNRVKLLNDFPIFQPATEEEPRHFSQEEINLAYVAITRGRCKVTDYLGNEVIVPEPEEDGSEEEDEEEGDDDDSVDLTELGEVSECRRCGCSFNDDGPTAIGSLESSEHPGYCWECAWIVTGRDA
jgi:F-box DNA helicase 1